MKHHAIVNNEANQNHKRQAHAPTFAKVLDARKQPIRSLWVRNGRFYAQLAVENPITGVKKTRLIPLKDKDGKAVATASQAVEELKRLQTQRADNALPVLSQQQKFADYAKHYLEIAALGKSGPGEKSKKASTVDKEETILNRWTGTIGQLRLDQIKRVHVNRFIEQRLKDNASPRTINLDVITLRVVLKGALSEGLIQRLPTDGLQPLTTTTRKRDLFTAADLDNLCKAALDKKESGEPVTKNGQEFCDYVRFMAYSGARRNEALGMQWADVDFDNGQLYLRRQITARGIEDLKNREERTVDFNPKLRALLFDIKARTQGVSQWLFPSPQRGDKDIPAKSFRESLELARTKAGLAGKAFHDLRHHFISMAVMSGIDFMTIAAWVGHKDGGVLIGKVYGHLANEHRQAMGEKMNFGPAIVAKAG